MGEPVVVLVDIDPLARRASMALVLLALEQQYAPALELELALLVPVAYSMPRLAVVAVSLERVTD